MRNTRINRRENRLYFVQSCLNCFRVVRFLPRWKVDSAIFLLRCKFFWKGTDCFVAIDGCRSEQWSKLIVLDAESCSPLSQNLSSPRENENFFIGNVEHGEIFSKILFVQRDKFCKYLIWYRVEMLSREESYAKRIELVMSFVYCAISLLFGLDRMKSKIGLEIERN